MDPGRAALEHLVLERVLSEDEFDVLLRSLSSQSIPFFVDIDPLGIRFLLGGMDEAGFRGRLLRSVGTAALLWSSLVFLCGFGATAISGPQFALAP